MCVVIQISPDYADTAEAMYHGFDWYGRLLEVREVSASLTNRAGMTYWQFAGPFRWSLWSWLLPWWRLARWHSWPSWWRIQGWRTQRRLPRRLRRTGGCRP